MTPKVPTQDDKKRTTESATIWLEDSGEDALGFSALFAWRKQDGVASRHFEFSRLTALASVSPKASHRTTFALVGRKINGNLPSLVKLWTCIGAAEFLVVLGHLFIELHRAFPELKSRGAFFGVSL